MITLSYRKKILSTQIMRMIIFHVFVAAESETNISFSKTRLDFDAHEVTIFRKQLKIKKLLSRISGYLPYL